MDGRLKPVLRGRMHQSGSVRRALAGLTISALLGALLAGGGIAEPAPPTPAARAIPHWSDARGATPEAIALLKILGDSADRGLRPADYGVSELDQLVRALQPPDLRQQRRFDQAMTKAARRFVTDLHCGRINPQAAGFELPAPCAHFDPAAVVQELSGQADTGRIIAGLEPRYLHYRLLEQALPRFRRLAAEPQLTRLPGLPARTLRLGQHYSGAAALRRLLGALGCLRARPAAQPAGGAPSEVLDAATIAGLKCYQHDNGLAVDGVLGPRTYAALVTPMAERVRQIELTLERWRWLPPLRPRTLVVNIPQFRLYYIAGGRDLEDEMLQMAVIVGRAFPRMRTPAFAADMTEVDFRPYWNVPRSILLHELLPSIRSNPRLVETERLQIVAASGPASAPLPATPQNLEGLESGRLRLRQLPGPDNSLGLIRFVLPNSHDVYLHATPQTALFARTRRAFSHGCIRVADPVGLAEAVLAGTAGDWTRTRILAAMHGKATDHVRLAKPVHVLIVYGTALAGEDGSVHFFNDLYGQDRRLERLLHLPPVAPSSAAQER